MMFPIEILKKNSISEILHSIYRYNKKILLKIRNDYIYSHQSLRELQNIMNKFKKKKVNLPNISKELKKYQNVNLESIETYFNDMIDTILFLNKIRITELISQKHLIIYL